MTSEPKIESTLFYGHSPETAFRKLPDALALAFANSSLETRPLLRTGNDLVIAIGGVTLTIALVPRGLDPAPLAKCNRPECATTPMEEAQLRLALHGAAVVVRVTGPDHAARLETRLALTYIAVMQMLQLAQPDVVHWAKSDTLYTIEEFRSSTGAHRPIRPRPARNLERQPARSVSRLPIPAQCKGRSFVPGMVPSADVPMAPAAQRPMARMKNAMNRGALAGMTAPLSVGYLLQYLLPGARLG